MANQQELSINLGIGILPDVKDQQLFNELARVYNALRNITQALDAYTGAIVPDEEEWEFIQAQQSYRVGAIGRMFYEASEPIASGAMVNLWNDAGVLKARPASAATSRRTHCWNARAADTGDTCLLTFPNSIHGGFSGLTPGQEYWMAGTAGLITPVVPGGLVQKVGYALSATELFFCPTLG